MPTVKIGRRYLASLPEVSRPTIDYDEVLKGFFVRRTPPTPRNPTGSATYGVEYRPGAGGRNVAKKRVSLGSIDILTPEQARDTARNMLAGIRLGADPAAERAEQRAAGTIRELREVQWCEQAPMMKAGTATLYSGYWRNHILPAIGNRAAADVSKRDVAALHREIGKSHTVTANRILTALSHFYTWAADHGYVKDGINPCRGVARFTENGRERYLSDDELARLGAAIRKAETTGVVWARVAHGQLSKHSPSKAENRLTHIDQDAADAIRLLLFTGARLREILNLRWSEYDRQRQLLFLADSKSGRKTIVLGGPAVKVLESLWERAAISTSEPESPFVFPTGDGENPKSDLKRPWAMVIREAGLPGLRIHDLRHSFASVGAGAGLGLPIIGRLLGHSSPSTTARYAHLDANPLKVATDLISNKVEAAFVRS